MTHYVTPPAIADRLGVDAHRVIAWIKRGQLAAVNIGDGSQRPRYRVSEADLQVFLAARTVQPPAPRVRRRRTDPNVIAFF